MDFLTAIEESGFCQWVREADSLFAFPGILLIHTIGMGVVVGINATFDARLLGFAPMVRLRAFEKLFPIMWIGFWVSVASGAILLAVNATKMTRNPDFYVKLAFIALATVNTRLLKKHALAPDETPTSSTARVLAVTSILFWLGAITCGRLLAYVGRSSGF